MGFLKCRILSWGRARIGDQNCTGGRAFFDTDRGHFRMLKKLSDLVILPLRKGDLEPMRRGDYSRFASTLKHVTL